MLFQQARNESNILGDDRTLQQKVNCLGKCVADYEYPFQHLFRFLYTERAWSASNSLRPIILNPMPPDLDLSCSRSLGECTFHLPSPLDPLFVVKSQQKL